MKVAFRESFLRDLRAIKDQGVLRRIRECIDSVEQVNKPSDLSNLKKLKAQGQYYRIRIGEHRVGLKIEGEIVTFIRVLNRKDIYKYFP
ncbi:MAG TPA: type II toxin-antitoxin system RelE/ParE family toxin [Pyrinomonadaceae bacterium]|nr:type II toxin-antitoxin system RelE/ParE family toxin [Pyrinomonadaceae bacterium]